MPKGKTKNEFLKITTYFEGFQLPKVREKRKIVRFLIFASSRVQGLEANIKGLLKFCASYLNYAFS